MPQISDPAFELHRLCRSMAEFSFKGISADALAALLNVEPASSDYFTALGAIAARFSRLLALYEQTLEDPVLSTATENLTAIQSFMRGDRQQANWNSVKGEVFSPAQLNVLLISSAAVRPKAPVFVPTKEEQQAAIDGIIRAMAALEAYDGPVSGALYEALRSTLRLIERLDIYGVDALIDEILRAFAIHVVDEREHEIPTKEREARASAWQAMAFLGAMLVAPDAFLTAVENHYDRAQTIIRMVTEKPRLIEGPGSAPAGGSQKPELLAITSEAPKPKRPRKRSVS